MEVTPAKKIKSYGLQGLTQVCTLTGQSPQTISNWHYSKPELFEVVLLGCVAKLGLVT